MNSQRLLNYVASVGVALVAGVMINSAFQEHQRREAYGRAYNYAINMFGDGKGPLEVQQRDKWYLSMGVNTNETPSRRDLEKFIARSQDKLLLHPNEPR